MAITSFPDENELLLQISNGDKRAFTKLFDRYYKPLSSYVQRITESSIVTEDIIQEVFIKIWVNRDGLVKINSISNYIFILSKNETLNHLRKIAKYTVRFQALDNGIDYSDSIESTDEIDEFSLLINKALEQLPPQQRKIYQLSKIDKLKHDEIAKQLNLSVETIKKHSSLAMKNIKYWIEKYLKEEHLLFITILYFFKI
jgi:RNA polymerase sigma-70 factor (family 1)